MDNDTIHSVIKLDFLALDFTEV